MSTLYLLNFNNYYNRTITRLTNPPQYQMYQVKYQGSAADPNGNTAVIEGVNFYEGDFVETTQVVNWAGDVPNYILVTENNSIKSRWFVLHAQKTRGGQLALTLRRDVIADYYALALDSPVFIEKATPLSIRDVAIYNHEDMTFNQIKTRFQPLYDKTGCPWIVGYIPRDAFNTDTPVQVPTGVEPTADYTYANISDYPYYARFTSPGMMYVLREASPFVAINVGPLTIGDNNRSGQYISVTQDGEFKQLETLDGTTIIGAYQYYSPAFTEQEARYIVQNFPTLSGLFKGLYNYSDGTLENPTTAANIIADAGKIIYETSTGKYYRLNVRPGFDSISVEFEIPRGSALYTQMNNAMNKTVRGTTIQEPTTGTALGFQSVSQTYLLSLTPYAPAVKATVGATRHHCPNTPYDIFCIPFSDELTIYKNGEIYIQNTSKTAGISIAQQIAAQVGSGNIYDIQILPYCPVQHLIKPDGTFDIGGEQRADIVTSVTDEKVSVLLWAQSDEINLTFNVDIPEGQTVLSKKVKSETEFIRIVSPNQSNMFEFNPQMNNGLEAIDVTCQYKPFNPYIKVQPRYNPDSLYGQSYDDARALICGGDFSVTQVTSAWADYQLQNKNYLAIFDRQIEHLEINNAVQRTREISNVIAGAVGAGVQGGAAGLTTGNPVGAVAGAALGGVSSLIGGIADIGLNDKLRNEAIDYTKDQFGYQLGNIRAIPQGLAKTSAIAPDNKYVPFIEFYEATSQEREALTNKLKYNGYTIMRISTIMTFRQSQPTYIKGRLIRLSNLAGISSHIINAIASEIYKGVFI